MSCPAVARNQLLLLPSEARGLEPALYVTPVISTGVEKSLTVFSGEPERCAGRSASRKALWESQKPRGDPELREGSRSRSLRSLMFSADGPLRNNYVRG